MRVLGVESSCDETGIAIVENGRTILANVVASQASVHERFGGVVPEVASRQQQSAILPVLETAMQQSRTDWADLDAIAVTFGPGLAGSLLVGLTAAKALSLARGLPFIGVNHLEGHIYANWLRSSATAEPADDPLQWPGDPAFPLLALVISGAHTELVHITGHGQYQLLGQTRDDAAGEAFDKVARLLGLGYPGGPAIERAAALAVADTSSSASNPYRLPRAWIPGTYDFSFSGLKTAVLQFLQGAQTSTRSDGGSSRYARHAREQGSISVERVAAAFQEAVVDVLASKTVRAARALAVRQVVMAGGVAANTLLRERLEALLAPHGIQLRYPKVEFCTDNAAMIAAAGYFQLRQGRSSDFDLDVSPSLQLPFAAG